MDHKKKGDTGSNAPQSSDQLRATPSLKISLRYEHQTGLTQMPQTRAEQHLVQRHNQNHQRDKSCITPTLSCGGCSEAAGGGGGGSPGSSLSDTMRGCVSPLRTLLPGHPR